MAKTLVNKETGKKAAYYEGLTEYREEFWILTDEEWDEEAFLEEQIKKKINK